jgi:hypothetical protein
MRIGSATTATFTSSSNAIGDALLGNMRIERKVDAAWLGSIQKFSSLRFLPRIRRILAEPLLIIRIVRWRWCADSAQQLMASAHDARNEHSFSGLGTYPGVM